MTAAIKISWVCLGKHPQIAPCGASGEGDKAAEAHVRSTGHSTLTGINPEALARAAARGGAVET